MKISKLRSMPEKKITAMIAKRQKQYAQRIEINPKVDSTDKKFIEEYQAHIGRYSARHKIYMEIIPIEENLFAKSAARIYQEDFIPNTFLGCDDGGALIIHNIGNVDILDARTPLERLRLLKQAIKDLISRVYK